MADPMSVEGLDPLLSPEGWVYASTPPLAEGDPGRYHALFGRDSLITALQVLPARPDVARATLRALAALQGRSDDPETDEQPGKILHEYRPEAPAWHTEHRWPVRDGVLRYYGSSDSTSWFLVLLATLGDEALTAELEPAWRAAGEWLERALAAGGGLVRYGPREHTGGLTQQGWRDVMGPSAEDDDGGGIVRPDGSTPRAPLADTDVQAVAYAALRALGVLSGDEAWSRRAEGLQSRIASDFGPGVMALEGDDLAVPGPGSQLGWLLWSGALSPARREAVAERLCETDVLTAWGLRTLAASSPVFDPQSYHRGSIWPFDSWLGWSGLRAAGRVEEAERVRSGVLAALDKLGHAPELYAVTADGELEPSRLTNLAQAWTVGARWAFENDWGGRPDWLDNRPAERAP
jgi:glycogen debranching enzyme